MQITGFAQTCHFGNQTELITNHQHKFIGNNISRLVLRTHRDAKWTILTHLQQTTFENILVKGQIAIDKQCLIL